MDANPKQAYGDAKVKLQLVPPAAMIAIARGLEDGAKKYGAWNWRDHKVEIMTYYGAVMRHMAAWLEGEEYDPDGGGKKHIDGALASLAIIIDAMECDSYIDNRPHMGNMGTLDALMQGSRKEMEDRDA